MIALSMLAIFLIGLGVKAGREMKQLHRDTFAEDGRYR